MLYPTGSGSDFSFYNAESGSNGPSLSITYVPRLGDASGATIDSTKLNNQLSMGVNVANGNLTLSNQDLSVAGTGLDDVIDRDYNSQASWLGGFGPGWGAMPSGPKDRSGTTPTLAEVW
jgi:hypothetical protein